jgi:hypothetical protein
MKSTVKEKIKPSALKGLNKPDSTPPGLMEWSLSLPCAIHMVIQIRLFRATRQVNDLTVIS